MVITVQIVNYNSRSNLAKCLLSVEKYFPRELELQVVIINNEEKKIESRSRNFGIDIVESGENLGFGKAQNRGSVVAKGKYLLLLNPDAQIFPGSVSSLLETFSADERMGIVGPLLLGEGGSLEKSHYGQGKTPLSMVKEKFFKGKPASFSENNTFEVDWVSGGAMMIKRDLFEQMGGFDENYFMYFEDVDLCLRARQLGWKVAVNPKSRVYHRGGQSFSSVKEKKKHYYQSQDYYLRKHFGPFWAWFAKVLRLPYYARNVWIR